MCHGEMVTRIVAKHNDKSLELEVDNKLGPDTLRVVFKDVRIGGIEGRAEVSVYVADAKVVLHIESPDGKYSRDDCVLIDGNEITISEEGSGANFSHVKNWRSHDDKVLIIESTGGQKTK